MPLLRPSHAPFFFPTHIGCIVYSLHNDLNLHAKIDGNGPILMKLRLGEVWCCDDEFRSQHTSSRIFVNIGLMSLMISSIIVRVEKPIWHRRHIQKTTQHGGTSAAALSWSWRSTVVWCVVCDWRTLFSYIWAGRWCLSGGIFLRRS
jgi:hypothetical protein